MLLIGALLRQLVRGSVEAREHGAARMRIPQSRPGFRNIELLGLFHRKRRPSTAIYRAHFVPPVTSRPSGALPPRRRRARCSRRRHVPDGGLSALELEISGPCAVAVPPLSRLDAWPPR